MIHIHDFQSIFILETGSLKVLQLQKERLSAIALSSTILFISFKIAAFLCLSVCEKTKTKY